MNYYGYKLHEINEMTAVDYNTLAKLMYMNEARDTLKGFEVSVYPKLKEESRKQKHKSYYKIAYPQNFEKKDIVKLSDLTKVINGR